MSISTVFAPEYEEIRAKIAKSETPDERAVLYDDVDLLIQALNLILERRVRKHLGGEAIRLDQQPITHPDLIAQAREATEQ